MSMTWQQKMKQVDESLRQHLRFLVEHNVEHWLAHSAQQGWIDAGFIQAPYDYVRPEHCKLCLKYKYRDHPERFVDR